MARPRLRASVVAVACAALVLASCSHGGGTPSATTSTARIHRPAGIPPIGHVFLIVLENKFYEETWGALAGSPYLATTLRGKGNLLSEYYATSHNSLGNYISMISGQPANPVTQADCVTTYENVTPPTVVNGIATGTGCVYPATVGNVASQLTKAKLTWKGYMESMARPCQHPDIGQADPNVLASTTSLYATRHNPFVYFQAITGSSRCKADDVPLTQLPGDLSSVSTTPNFSFITPNLCDDGHDVTCAAGGPAGFDGINAFLQKWVPKILGSPAFKQDGLLLITFDESDATGVLSDDRSCCNEPPSIGASGAQNAKPGLSGPGGGRVGLLAISRFIKPGSTTATPYNHFSMLRTVEDVFGLAHLGEAAAPGLASFGPDVFTRPTG